MANETEIQPALTAEEWASKGVLGNGVSPTIRLSTFKHCESLYVDDDASFIGVERHQLAALALYGQPFGFTQADVDMLRRACFYGADVAGIDTAPLHEQRRTLIERIAALLPPHP